MSVGNIVVLPSGELGKVLENVDDTILIETELGKQDYVQQKLVTPIRQHLDAVEVIIQYRRATKLLGNECDVFEHDQRYTIVDANERQLTPPKGISLAGLYSNLRIAWGVLMDRGDNGFRCIFPMWELAPLISHSQACTKQRLSEGKGPGLIFVRDEGVYLISNGAPSLAFYEQNQQVVYANGMAVWDDDWYDVSANVLGFDDFTMHLPTSVFKEAQEQRADFFMIEVDEEGVSASYVRLGEQI